MSLLHASGCSTPATGRGCHFDSPANFQHGAQRRWLLKDENGRLTKEKARGCIDGSIWYQLAAENEHRQVRSSSFRPRSLVRCGGRSGVTMQDVPSQLHL